MDKINVYMDMDGVLAVYGKGDTVEQMGKPGYFKNRPVQENVIELMQALDIDESINLTVLSSVFDDDHSVTDKLMWLVDNGLEDIRACFVPCGQNKADFIAAQGINILIDDFSDNLFLWEGRGAGFTGIKFMNGINGSKGTWARHGGYTLDVSMDACELYDRIVEICDEIVSGVSSAATVKANGIQTDLLPINDFPVDNLPANSLQIDNLPADACLAAELSPTLGVRTPSGIQFAVA